MKKLFLITVAATVASVVLVACEKGTDPEPDRTVKVTGITISGDETITKVVGDADFTLTAAVAPADATNKNVKWMSSDPAKVTVSDEGLVHIVAASERVRLTVISVEGAFTDFVDVTVNEMVVPVSGITLDKETASIAHGQELTLIATVEPGNASSRDVVWSTSDETVATVENGIVTTHKTGSVTITATSSSDDTKKDECAITIENVLLGGVIWSEFNVDAPGTFVDSREKVGMFYQWGIKVGWSYGAGHAGPLTSTAGATTWNTTGNTTLGAWPADANPCPAGWRMMTSADFAKIFAGGTTAYMMGGSDNVNGNNANMITKTKWTPDYLNGVGGLRIADYDRPDLFLFFPVDGFVNNNMPANISSKSTDYTGTGDPANGGFNGTSAAGTSDYWCGNQLNATSTTDGARVRVTRGKSTSGLTLDQPRVSADAGTSGNRLFGAAIRCVKDAN